MPAALFHRPGRHSESLTNRCHDPIQRNPLRQPRRLSLKQVAALIREVRTAENPVIHPPVVLQEAYREVAATAAEYAARPEMPFFLWVRMLTGQKLLQTKMRDASQEISRYGCAPPEADSLSLASRLLGRLTTPSVAAMRSESQVQLQQALNAMDPGKHLVAGFGRRSVGHHQKTTAYPMTGE